MTDGAMSEQSALRDAIAAAYRIGAGRPISPPALEAICMVAVAYAEVRRLASGKDALLHAADWFERDDDEGPSYHINGFAHYDGPPWIAAHLRALADQEEE